MNELVINNPIEVPISSLVDMLINQFEEKDILKLILELLSREELSYKLLIDVVEQATQIFRDGLSCDSAEEDIKDLDRYSSMLLNKMEVIEEHC